MATNPTVGRPPGSRNFKSIIRMEKAVRLEAIGVSDADIATHLGMTPAGLATLKTSPEYHAIRLRKISGVISEYEEGLGEDLNYLKSELREHVPQALQVLVDSLSSSDEKLRCNVAQDLLDRHGHMAKVSRTGLPAEDQGGSNSKIDSAIADGLVNTLKGLNNVASQSVGSGSSSTTNTGNSSSNQPTGS